MYELNLDSSSIANWRFFVNISWALFAISLAFLVWRLYRAKFGVVAILTGLLLISSIVSIWNVKLSPYSFYRSQMEPTLERGNEVLHKYAEYKEEHGRFPASVKEVYFPELDYFDYIVGVRKDEGECDGFGVGCIALNIDLELHDAIVEVHHELFECHANRINQWKCRDHK